MSDLKSFEEAIEIIKANTAVLSSQAVDIRKSLGRVLAKDVISAINQHGFNNSAVDGIGVTLTTLNNLKKDKTKKLKIKQTILAGEKISLEENLKEDECFFIMTGAIVPSSVNTVFLIEETTRDKSGLISVNAKLLESQNIRLKGEDFKDGDILVKKGEVLSVNNLSLIAAAGVKEIEVYKKPKVAIFTTGRETKNVGENIELGEIYNSNIITMELFFKKLNCDVLLLDNVPDSFSKLEENIEIAKKEEVDIIVSSGAVSMGVEDIVKEYLLKNTKVLYNGLKIRPGKPNMLAKIGSILYFGLPGNPVSSFVGLSTFVKSYYNFTHNLGSVVTEAKLEEKGFSKKKNFKFFARGFTYNGKAKQKVIILEKQGSHIISTLAKANCLVKINEDIEKLDVGMVLEVIPFD